MLDEQTIIIEPVNITKIIIEDQAKKEIMRKGISEDDFLKEIVEATEGIEIGGFEILTLHDVDFIIVVEGTEMSVDAVY